MTSEGEGQTTPWIEKHGARYAYGYDKGGKLKTALGIGGIPAAVLVNPSGTIVWEGHPSRLTNAIVAKAVTGAIPTPIYEWGKSAKDIKKSFLKGDYAKAIKAADKLAAKEEVGKELATMLREVVTKKVASYEADLERGDVRKANEGAKAFQKAIKGMPEEEVLKALVTRISKDKELKAVLKAQDKLAGILASEVKKRKDCQNSLKRLKSLLEDHEGTFTGGLIEAAISDYRKRLPNLRG